MKSRGSLQAIGAGGSTASREEVRIASRDLGQGLHQTEISVPEVHCAACIRAVETGLLKVPGVEFARVNLSTKRAHVNWRGTVVPDLLGALETLGFSAYLLDSEGDQKDPEVGRLIRALAVAGFAAMNTMLLSISVWSGADPSTRHAFHWISAGLALPCLVYSGRIFFLSAWSALRSGHTNMDVPISIGVLLAFGLSLYDTVHNGPHAYFDAVVSLIFFLLIGRTLDRVMREKARSAVRGLERLAPRIATVLRDDGRRENLPVAAIEPGTRIQLVAGDRIPVDGIVVEGMSDLDCALATGESAPRQAKPGCAVQAGMLNLSGPLIVRASARATDSFLAEMVRLMEAVEGGRARYRRLADRAARLYSPVVHSVAFLTFVCWAILTGDAHRAITVAISVLIITCPCALGLAVPIVQVVAARRLFESGIMVKDGSALERLAEIDTIAFDKTGTLTLGRPRLVGNRIFDGPALRIAAAIALRSNHPLSHAIAAGAETPDLKVSDVVERAGLGVEANVAGSSYRLGRAAWALSDEAAGTGTVLSRDGREIARFTFEDVPRPGMREAFIALRKADVRIVVLSGDERHQVTGTLAGLDIDELAAELFPADKVNRIKELSAQGRKILMVGDGINDAPALVAAHVSMAPAEAADIGRNSADFVFLHQSLNAVPTALFIARQASVLIRQNFGLAVAYNAIALPIAIAGYVTPLIAALAMSFSSLLVVLNALRLKAGKAAGKAGHHSSRRPAASRPSLEPGE